jgi:predicted phosphodiesterase
MIYTTGDTHGSLDIDKLNTKNFPQQKTMTKADYVIIAGDFGLIWSNSKEEKYWLNWLETRNFTTLFVDGNHENFDLLNSYPVSEWSGGKVHQISDSIYHLMRGQVFVIDGKKIFTFGGAMSIDKAGRTEFKSWWKQEIPSGEEFLEAEANLIKNNRTVDFIITHTAPQGNLILFGINGDKYHDPVAKLLTIFRGNRFKHWYFGHLHIDKTSGNFTALYDKIVEMKEIVSTVDEEIKLEKELYRKNAFEYLVEKNIRHEITDPEDYFIACANDNVKVEICPKRDNCQCWKFYEYMIKHSIRGQTCTVNDPKTCDRLRPYNDDD